MKKIAVDIMGGDHAPQAILEGIEKAVDAFPHLHFILVGNSQVVTDKLKRHDRVSLYHTDEKIESEDEPVASIRRKKQASMVVAAQLVKEGSADALLSAGNTGALLAAGLLVIGRIKGIDRPGLMPVLPTLNPQAPRFILMDGGANADCKPVNLLQFGILANVYAQSIWGIEKPRIGLINNGTETSKGSELTKAAFHLLEEEENLNFVGNVETKSLLEGVCDIAVTDGFTGNAVLKTFEGSAKSIFKAIKAALLNSGVKAKIGAFLIQDALKNLRTSFDDSSQGGAILLGIKAPLVKAHGSADALAIFNAVRQVNEMLEAQVIEKVQAYFEKI